MFMSDASRRALLQAAEANPLSGPVLDYDATFARSLVDQRTRLNSDSEQNALVAAYDDYTDEIWKTTGERLPNPHRLSDEIAATAPREADARQAWWDERRARFDGRVSELASQHPGLAVKSQDEIQAEIYARIRAVKAEAERPGVEVGWSKLGTFLGAARGALEDPAIAASMIFGGFGGAEAGITAAARATLASRLAPFGRTFVREGVINAGTEIAIQPQVKSFNNAAGIAYGWDDAGRQIALSGVVGGTLGTALHGAGAGLKSLLGDWDAAKAKGLVPDGEAQAAEQALRAIDAGRSANPFPAVDGDALYRTGLGRALDAVASGRTVDLGHLRNSLADVVFPPPPDGVKFDLAKASPGAILPADDLAPYVHGYLRPQNFHAVKGAIPRFLFHLAPLPERMAKEAAEINPKFADLSGAPLRMSNEVVDKLYRRFAGDPPTAHQIIANIPDILDSGTVRKGAGDRVMSERTLLSASKVEVAVFEVARHGDGVEIVSVGFRDPPGQRSGGGGPKDRPRLPGGEPQPHHTVQASQGGAPAVADFPPLPVAANIAPPPPKSKAPPATLPPELRPPSAKPPETLAGFLKRMGGIKDDDGWLAHMGVDNTVRPGLISGRGMPLDDAMLRAWEAGFFPEAGTIRPDMDRLRLALADELGPEGVGRVRAEDETARIEWESYNEMMAGLDRMGVDPHGKSWDEVKAAVELAREAERAEADNWRVALAFLDEDAAKALDDDAALVARVRGELWAEDVAIPTGLTDADRRPVMASALDAMDAFDDEAMAWDAAVTCSRKF